MKAIVLIHTASEGPGSLGDYLRQSGIEAPLIRLDLGEPLPEIGSFDAIVSMGGTMNVYEEDKFPFLGTETDLLRKAIELNIPILGVCLGAQMIAKAAGASVTKSPKPELGWDTVTLTKAAKDDAFLAGTPTDMDVFQYHEDMFGIPAGGVLLAKSGVCPHQAFRVANAYGFQFHVEVTPDMIMTWFADSPDLPHMLSGYDQVKDTLIPMADRLYANFVKNVKQCR